MMDTTSFRPFLLDRFRRSRWLSLLILPFFLLSAVESANAIEVLAKEKAQRDFKINAGKKIDSVEPTLIDPDAYLKQTLVGNAMAAERQNASEEMAAKASPMGPDNGEIRRLHREQVRQARFRHFEELREHVRRMKTKSLGGTVPSEDWKALDLKLKNITVVGKQIEAEAKEESKSLSKRGAGFWKRYRYSSQQKKMIRAFLNLAGERDELVRNRNLDRMVKVLELNKKDEPSRKEFKTQFRSIQADLQKPGRPKAKSDGTRRQTNSQPTAQMEWIRLADGGGGGILTPPTPAPTYGESIDPAVGTFAQEHGYDAGRIFKAIYDLFEYEPYYGITKSARGTLLDRKGNDWDLALLLRDALRISGYEAELEHGLVENEFSELARFLGVDNPEKVSYILATAGVPGSIIQDGNRKFARFEHVWVAAKVPFDDYRGRAGSTGDRQWIDLDPSFKEHDLKAGIPVAGGLTFSFNDYIVKAQGRSPQEYFEDSLWMFMKRAAIICNTLGEIPLRSMIEPLKGSYLPNGLKSTRVSTIGSYRSAPDAYKKKVRIALEDSDGDALLSRIVTLEDALYRSVALTYGPASNSDSLIMHSYGGMENTPPYLLRLRPELRIDGKVVQVGDEVGAGRKLQVRLDISGQRLNEETEYFPALAGAEMALVLAQGGVSAGAFTQHISILSQLQNDDAVPERARVAQQRYLLGAKYYHEIGRSAERLGGYFNYRYVGGVHAGFCATKFIVGGLFGLANTWSREGTVFSAERFSLGMVPLNSGAVAASPVFNRIFGTQSSFLEHQSGEAVNNRDFISTVKVFQIAAEEAIGFDTLTAANLDAKLPSFSFLDAEAVADIRNATGLGRMVILPVQQVTRNQWTGTGYINLNPSLGSGDHIISGRFAGGDETGDEETDSQLAGCACSGNDSRVYQANGQYVTDYTELVQPAKGVPAVFSFGYNSQRQYPSELGYGWEQSFGRRLYVEGGGSKVTFYNEEHLAQVFLDSSGSYLHPAGFFASLTTDGGLYKLSRKDLTTWTFAPSGQLLSILNRDSLGLFVDTTTQGLPSVVKDAGGDTLFTFAYAGGQLASVQDSLGRTVSFDQDINGDLAAFTNAAGDTMSFTYYQDHNLESKIDGLENTSFFLYDQRDRLMEYTDPRGKVTGYLHDDDHRLFVEVDPAGREQTYFHDAKGFPSLKVDGSGNRESTRYDSEGNLVFKQDSRGFKYEAIYDGFGNKLSEVLPDSTRKFYAYDSLHLITKDSNATEAAVLRYEYTAKGHLQQQDNADGTHETFLYNASGQMIRKVGRAEDTSYYAYHASGSVSSVTNPVGDVTAYLYDSLGRTAGFVSGVGDTIRITLDAKDRLVSLRDAEGHTVRNLYDEAGNRTAWINASGDTTRITRDASGNPVEIVFPDGAVLSQEFNAQGQLTAKIDPLGRVTRFEYEGDQGGGRLKKVIDPMGQTMAQAYCGEEPDPCDITDKSGRLFRVERDGQYRLAAVTDPLGHKTTFTYDSQGRKIGESKPNGRTTSFTYDTEGRLIRSIGPLGDTTYYVYNALGQQVYAIAPGHDTTALTYDKSGNALTNKDPNGFLTYYGYDAAGRRDKMVDANGDTTRYTYDGNGQIVRIRYQDGVVDTFAYNAEGRKVHASNGKVAYQYRYDKRGRLAEFLNQGLAKSVRYAYDQAGNLTSRLNGEGELTSYAYDALDRLVETRDISGGLTRYEYDAMGRRARLEYPNQTRIEYKYDAGGRTTEQALYNASGTVLDRYRYAYDGAGNLLSETSNQGSYSYSYDRLDRLKSILYPDGSSKVIRYDAGGRKSLEVESRGGLPDSSMYHYTGTRLDSITGTTNRIFTFDAAGRLVQSTGLEGATRYTYASKGDPIRIQYSNGQTLAFAHDVNRVPVVETRISEKVAFLLDPQAQGMAVGLTAAYREGVKIKDFGLGPMEGEILWQKDSTGIRYFHYDGKGTMVAITSAAGALVGDLGFTDQGTARDSSYGQAPKANPDPVVLAAGTFGLAVDPKITELPVLPIHPSLQPLSKDPLQVPENPWRLSTTLPVWLQSQAPGLPANWAAGLQGVASPRFHRAFVLDPTPPCLPDQPVRATLARLEAEGEVQASGFALPYTLQKLPTLPAQPRPLPGTGPLVQIFLSPNPAAIGETVVARVQATSDVAMASVQLYWNDSLVTLNPSLEFSFAPQIAGVHAFTAIATDIKSRKGTIRGGLLVDPHTDNTPPTLSLTFDPASPNVGDSVTITATATDNAALDSQRVWLQVDGRYLNLDPSFQARYHAVLGGDVTVVATAYDMAGNFQALTDTLLVDTTGVDIVLPTAAITSPSADSVLYLRTPVRGTASDPNFAYYTLSHRWKGAQDTVEFHRGTSQITNNVLGYMDATSLENGDYELILTVVDAYRNVKRASVDVRVTGEAKIGNFSLSFKDLSIPLPGLNLEVLRTYNSQDKLKGDFGFGWKLDMKTIVLTENGNQGDDWTITRSGGPFTAWQIKPNRPHTVSVRVPGLRDQVFDVTPAFDHPVWSPVMGKVTYTPRKGVVSRLEALDGGVFKRNASDLLAPDGLDYYDPSRYQLTMQDGTRLVLDQARQGVVEITDPNGNHVTLSPAGVTHSTGEEIRFNRDSQGRISSIVDGERRTVAYAFDGHGNLASSSDPMGHVTQYKYAPNHYLTDIVDPLGVRASRTEYDDAGKMVRQITPAGDTVLLTHDLIGRQETVEDAEGGITQFSYDEQGNVTSKTDATGATWNYAYDSAGNLLQTTFPHGGTTISEYDASGNEIRHVDELGAVTVRTFNDLGKVLSETDPLGRITRHEYDARGNLTRTIGPDGKVQSENTFDGQGNLVSEKDALGRTTQHEYTADGQRSTTTDALGRIVRMRHDSHGNLVEEIDAAGQSTLFTYDANGNQLSAEDALGQTEVRTYDALSRLVQQRNKLNFSTHFKFDLNGNKVLDSMPDGTTRRRAYDGRGNMIQSTDELGRITQFRYDAEGRLLETEFADSSMISTEYDSLGRRKATVDARGNRTQYFKDRAGRDTLVKDALGHVTRYVYDIVGRKTAEINALGIRTEFRYDTYDRLIETIHPDGSNRRTVFDVAGQKASEVDPEGKTTYFTYDAVGNLTSVKDAMGFITRYGYDARNNRISQTDANGHITVMAYDALGRQTSRTYPNNDQERWGYDAQSQMLYHVKGPDSTHYRYNSMGLDTLKGYTGGHTVVTKYTTDHKPDTISDYRGHTHYAYDIRGRQLRVTHPNGQFIENKYDRNGNRTHLITPFDTTRYSYDSLNRMDSVISTLGATRYFYTAVGNLDSIARVNGIGTKYAYDSLNRLTQVKQTGPSGVLSSYTYTLNKAGIRTKVVELDSSAVQYGYDHLYRLTSEGRTGTHVYTNAFAYDSVGNRLLQVKGGDSIRYVYNTRDQLVEENSPSLGVNYAYDAAGRLVVKATGVDTTEYAWVDGDRLDSITGVSPLA